MLKKFFVFIVFFYVLIFTTGKILDYEAELAIDSIAPKDDNGIMCGEHSIESKKGGKNAIIMLHGIGISPKTFKNLIQDLSPIIDSDIFAPLLPFHGKGLKEAKNLDYQIVKNFVMDYLEQKSQSYQTITLLAMSFSSMITQDILRTNPEFFKNKNINIILYAPYVFNESTNMTKIKSKAYSYWRSYCNYPQLGCGSYYYDYEYKKCNTLRKSNYLKYDIMSHVDAVMTLSELNKDTIKQTKIPFSIIVSKDDNWVKVPILQNNCEINKNFCNFHLMEYGVHYPHIGETKDEFIKILLKIINKPQ